MKNQSNESLIENYEIVNNPHSGDVMPNIIIVVFYNKKTFTSLKKQIYFIFVRSFYSV